MQGKSITHIWVDELATHPNKRQQVEIKNAFYHFFGGKPMTKFAPVAPIHIYESMANRGYIPSNVLVLAHDVVKPENAPHYHKLFHNRWAAATVILDNSVIELGGAVEMSMIKEAAEIVNADVVVLPDSLTDGVESAKITINAYDDFRTEFEDTNLMAVIQGETEVGFMKALEMIATEIEPDWISVPRRTESKFGFSRIQLIDFVQIFFPDKPIHLLGFSEYPWQDIRAASHPSVVSIDSAAPLRLPNGDVFSNSGPKRITDGVDWWDVAKFEKWMLDNISKIDNLIDN